jgi:hypothetical protein
MKTPANDVPELSKQQYIDQLVDCLLIWGFTDAQAMSIISGMRHKVQFMAVNDLWKVKPKQTREQLEAVAKSVHEAVWGKVQ